MRDEKFSDLVKREGPGAWFAWADQVSPFSFEYLMRIVLAFPLTFLCMVPFFIIAMLEDD